MPHEYRISTGEMLRDGELLGKGYSGFDPDPTTQGEPGEGKNDPTDHALRGVGPIPPGRYFIRPPRFSEHTGPYVLDLVPAPGTDTHGRSGFQIHGDSLKQPGQGSHGCICIARSVRMNVWESGDRVLDVVEGPATTPTERSIA